MRKALLVGFFGLLLAGCATTKPAVTPSGVEYRVTTDNCQCEQYSTKDPAMPVRYDFALSHLGISGTCASRKDARRCSGCPLKPICRYWV